MKKKFIATILIGTLVIGTLSGCGNSSQTNIETTTQTEEITIATADTEAEDTTKAEEEAAREEEANSYYETGRACLYGLDGQEIDIEEAYTNFETALELGKIDANFYLGLLYYGDYGYPETDYTKAKTYFEATENNTYAQILLGEFYYFGEGVEEDKTKGQELVDDAIAQGYVEGYLTSGYIASNSEENYEIAFEYYNKALEGEEQYFIASAMDNIGYAYKYGLGVEQDYDKALEWYEKAADLGDAFAMNELGYRYAMGEIVEQDYAKALEWYQKAADLGNTDAMGNIGYMYQNGIGVEQDSAKAQEWYDNAAAAEE